jgi:hypothetical protein
MKKSLLIAAFALGTYMVSAQAPEKMSYQAVVRNATGQLIQNQNVGIKASVLQNSATGAVVYSETLSGTTNANGLVSLAIGSGTILSGTFASIDWSTGNYYLKTETDPTGGTNYTIAGTSQLLSVPYAMYAKNAGFKLPYAGTSSADIVPFKITNSGASSNSAGYFENTSSTNVAPAISGINNSVGGFGTGVYGQAQSNPSSSGVLSTAVRGTIMGTGTLGIAISGRAAYGWGVSGDTDDGTGVRGLASGTGTAGLFISSNTGKALVTNGALKFSGINEGAGKVLTSDATGNATWQDPAGSGSGWSLEGNTVTDYDFIGTLNDKPLRFKINNEKAGAIGRKDTSFGFYSYNGTSELYNSAFGSGALGDNTTGAFNTAIGATALNYNTKGSNNIAVGSAALFNNKEGNYNIATGNNALHNNTDGSNNIAMGTNALYANTTGIQNVAIGANSISVNTTGNYNVATGTEALQSNTGSWNVANGHQALKANTTGNSNIAIGANSLGSNVGGSNNVAMGSSALQANKTGIQNIAIGEIALSNNVSGSGNVAIGYQTLFIGAAGSHNTAVGHNADVLSDNLSNATAIGFDAFVSASNKIRLGNGGVTVIEGQVPFSNVSDERFKYDIKNNVPGLDFIKKLKPVTYYIDTEKMDSFLKTGAISNSKSTTSSNKQMNTGFLAQEVAKTAAELGYSFDGVHAPTNDKDYYSIAYSQFVMPLVKAVQEQQVMIETLEKRIEELEKK